MAGVRKLRSGTWQGWYQHYEGRRAFFTLTRAATRREVLNTAQALEVHHAQMRLGVLPRPDQQHRARARPIADVVSEYLAWGASQGGRGGGPMAPRHVVGLRRLLAWWQCQLHLTTLADCCDIHPAVERVVREQAARGLASQTLRHYSSTLAAFCAWCVRRRYLPQHPLQHFRPPRATPRIHRRQLTSTEIARLLEACQPEHCLLYLTALCTGLRAAELRQLSLAHLDLDAGGLRLDAAWTKNRQTGFQPLPGDLIAALAASGQSDAPAARYARARGRYAYPARPLLFVPTKTALCLAGDLCRAGIPRETPEGILDFHSLRVTYINLVIASGATPTEAQRLARHQTVQMTLGVYGRTHEDRLHALVDRIATEVFPTALRASSVHAQVVGRAEPASFLAHRGDDPQHNTMLPS